jgi:hypothetical protein
MRIEYRCQEITGDTEITWSKAQEYWYQKYGSLFAHKTGRTPIKEKEVKISNAPAPAWFLAFHVKEKSSGRDGLLIGPIFDTEKECKTTEFRVRANEYEIVNKICIDARHAPAHERRDMLGRRGQFIPEENIK